MATIRIAPRQRRRAGPHDIGGLTSLGLGTCSKTPAPPGLTRGVPSVLFVSGLLPFLVAVAAEIAIVIAVPPVIVLDSAAITLPIALKEAFPVVTRPDPVGAGVGWPSPVSVMPLVVVSDGVPVAIDPKVIRPRGAWPSVNDARRRRCPNSYADR
jgi:hypothetical protein